MYLHNNKSTCRLLITGIKNNAYLTGSTSTLFDDFDVGDITVT